jgi:hypothetical protein
LNKGTPEHLVISAMSISMVAALTSLGSIEREGGAFGFFFFHFAKEFNNNNKWRVSDRIDRVM